MLQKWNLVKEVRKRENGHVNDLSKLYFSSLCHVENITFQTVLPGNMETIDFKRNVNLLLGTNDEELKIWNWNKNPKTMVNHKLGLPSRNRITDGKFLNTVGSVDTIVEADNSLLFHVPILASGPIISTRFEISDLKHFTVNPQACNEIITVGWNSKDIHLKDIRSGDANNTCINTHSVNRIKLSHVSHHPFAPEISVCGYGAYTHVYDKRNMRQVIHRLGPRATYFHPTITAFSKYNYAGEEIMTQYSPQVINIYENKTNGKQLYSLDAAKEVHTADFMGPYSEYVVTTRAKNATFWDKKSETEIVTLCSRDYVGRKLITHPQMPIAASIGIKKGAIIIGGDAFFTKPYVVNDSSRDDDDTSDASSDDSSDDSSDFGIMYYSDDENDEYNRYF